MSDTIKVLTETVRGRVITASEDAERDLVHASPPDQRRGAASRCRRDRLRTQGQELCAGDRRDLARLCRHETNTKWVRDYYAAIHPHSGSDGGYINFMSGDDGHRSAENYGASYERLSAVKAGYDPDNLFHVNQNIAPAKWRSAR